MVMRPNWPAARLSWQCVYKGDPGIDNVVPYKGHFYNNFTNNLWLNWLGNTGTMSLQISALCLRIGCSLCKYYYCCLTSLPTFPILFTKNKGLVKDEEWSTVRYGHLVRTRREHTLTLHGKKECDMQNNKSRYTFTAIRWLWIGSTSI